MRGITASKDVAVTVTPLAAQTDDYGYLMVHFVEDSEGYAEKIYLDVSRGRQPRAGGLAERRRADLRLRPRNPRASATPT